jgi:CPA2 family monovalent cation:H+ antiporter-2
VLPAAYERDWNDVLHAEHLKGILIFLVAAGILVPLLHRFLGTVLGFLLIGLVLGPFGIGYLDDHYPILRYITLEGPKAAEPLAELGVVFLLFLLGMELSLQRLWQLRRYVLGVGLVQVGVCIVAIGTIIRMSGITPPAGLILGMCFALSSTAIVMQLLVEQHRAATPVGRVALSVLLFQDLCVVPVLFTIGILEARSAGDKSLFDLLLPFGQAFAAVALIMVIGRYVVTPLIRSAARTGSRELIMAITLTIVVGISAATGASGLSVALGAFLAGLLLSDSEYRHQIEVDLDPFKGLLLGIFFVTVGMVIDLAVVWRYIGWILLALIGLVAIKAVVLYGAARLFRVQRPIAAEVALLLAQGGEFAFIVIALASGKGLLEPEIATSAVAVAGLSMMVTPALAKIARALAERLEPMEHAQHSPGADMAEVRDHVVIGGFGRVGQTVAKVLDSENVPWIAFDTNGALVTEHRDKNRPVYFGDASRHEILHHAGYRKARAFIVTLGSAEATERMVTEIIKLRPKACVLARAKDSEHAVRLTKLGAADAIPEAVEASLQLAGRLLENLDFPEDVADRRIADIRNLEVVAVRRAAKKAKVEKAEQARKPDSAQKAENA